MNKLSIIPEETGVILIGVSDFPRDREYLTPLPSVRANVRDFEQILNDSRIIGIPRINIITFLDGESSPLHSVLERVKGVSKEAQDTLLVYYSGHGLIEPETHELYLALSDTTSDNVDNNALPVKKIQSFIKDSGARKKILILDCCFSRRALDSFMGTQNSVLQATIERVQSD